MNKKPIIFDGNKYKKAKLNELKPKVKLLKKKVHSPKLATILASKDKASELYVHLKQKAASEIGVELEIFQFSGRGSGVKIMRLLKVLDMDTEVLGVMIQFPVTPKLKEYTSDFLRNISPQKDIDGLRADSPYLPATVLAIKNILAIAQKELKISSFKDKTFAVIGSRGMVGAGCVELLRSEGYEVMEIDRGTKYGLKNAVKADIVISATGRAGTVHARHIKPGAIVIDVGSPQGDVDFDEVAPKTSFITPVPGGVGPVTIASLMENFVKQK